MNQFELAQSLIERCRGERPASEIAEAFRQCVEALGFRHYACCSHVDPLRPPRGAVMLHNYPPEWVRQFSELEFYYIDPVFQCASRCITPFFWDAPQFRAGLTAPQLEIMIEAKRHGIERGYTVPIHSPGVTASFPGSCSVVPGEEVPQPASYLAVQLVAAYVYEALSREAESKQPRRSLTRRERQCLELAAQGKSDWAAGRILRISERTVHNHIENAKRRLSVATRVQAIVHALVSRQISFGDVIRSSRDEADLDMRKE